MDMTAEEIAKWKSGLRAFDADNRAALCAIFAVLGVPESYLDIGCGSGAMARLALAMGVDAVGVDRLPHEALFLIQYDLSQPLDFQRKFKIVTSIEVAEHIAESAADVYAETIARHVAPDGWLIFTSALPGQPGDGHVNCQYPSYWREKFERLGLAYHDGIDQKLTIAWRVTKMCMHWLPDNLQVFYKAA